MPARNKPSSEKSVSQMMARQVEAGVPGSGAVLYRKVATLLRDRLAPEDDAELIAGWFDRLAAGEEANLIFSPKSKGRPKNSLKTAIVRGREVTRPDDFTLCWNIRRLIEEGFQKDKIFAELNRRYGLKIGSLKNIYRAFLKLHPNA